MSKKLGKIVNCKTCGKEVFKKKYILEKFNNHYCSTKCRKNSNIKRCIVCETEFYVPNYRDKLSKFCSHPCRHKYLIGKPPSNFKGTDDFYYKVKVFIRDNDTCKLCGFSEFGIMQLDHINPKCIYPELRFVMDNLQTLCPNCHARKTKSDKLLIKEFKNKI